MKFIAKYIFITIVAMAASAKAHASGCGWQTRFEKGIRLGNEVMTGQFTCSQSQEFYNCSFRAEKPQLLHFFSQWIGKDQVPQVGQTVSVEVDVFEGMAWEDCDGSDPVPEFHRNGILKDFYYRGVYYQGFIYEKH